MCIRIEVGPDLYQEVRPSTAKMLIERVLQALEHVDLDDPEDCQEALEEIQDTYHSVLDYTLGDMIRRKIGEDLPRTEKVRRLAGFIGIGGIKQANILLQEHNEDFDAAMEAAGRL